MPYGPEVGDDESPPLRPMVVSETQTRLESRKTMQTSENVESRKIKFRGDYTGTTNPTSLPFEPVKCTRMGSEAMTISQLLAEVKLKMTKMMGKKEGRTCIMEMI